MEDELENMARYLIEKAPKDESLESRDDFSEMQRKTKPERKALQLKEYIIRCQVELCVLRCLRPDLMQAALHKLVGTMYDFSYLSFELDVLAKFIDPDGTLAFRRNRQSGALQSGRGMDAKKNNATFYTPPVRRATENSI
jgi:hypothetical protein